MTLTSLIPDLQEVPSSLVEEAIFDSFVSYTQQSGLSLYPAQEEAAMALMGGDNVILATPTGSGKSMVALAAHFYALAKGQRSFYTAPIKALVSEKFFSLCEVFGPENVGMMTGDATVNGQAPIVCATAEIVANIALRQGADADIDQVVMDEFHYYSDPQRGWAWQVPLLELSGAQFLLMSATLGDTEALSADLSERTGRPTTLVAGAQRPVPLEFSYVYTPVHETVEELLAADKAPIYVVHFSQREASERAQALTSVQMVSKEEKEKIATEIGDFRFSTTFGKDLSKLLRRGIGVHHAGMLPKYRRLVERLAQTGLLKVICGTDTLGVGINVPIRTVLMTGLAKFDGTKERIVSSREFHQIAGRAGRAGFDTVGYVVIEAPEHEIENVRLRKRAGGDEKKLKKLKKKSAPAGRVSWTDSTYERLTVAEPEQLVSQFRVSNSMVLNLLARGGDTGQVFGNLLRGSHNTRAKQNQDIRTTIELVRGLLSSGVAQRVEHPGQDPAVTYELCEDIQRDFALNQPLAPLAVAMLEVLDPDSETYALDVVSVFEAVLDDPRPVLVAQEKAARGEELAALKAEGVEYTERMALLEEVTYPQPLAELIEQSYQTYCEGHPWAREFSPSPKSVVRDMVEHGMTFSDMVATYKISRAEGVLLRYLTDAWRTLSHSVPAERMSQELDDIIVWLGELIRQVDSSLVDEWALMADPDAPISKQQLEQERGFGVTDPQSLSANKRALTIMVRNYMFRLVELFAFEKEAELESVLDYLSDSAEGIPDFGAALDDYFEEYADLDVSPAARGPEYFRLDTGAPSSRVWQVRQIIKDPADDKAFAFVAEVDLDASDAAGEVRLGSLRIDYA
ncbi:DEAD/DEAH box helicase [Corynebacterium aquilae]|uniref:DEAD/DEAH box helicase n=1 Tax=Corynebacterium aquilae DSM 44791 TaxID=1431546 RepID=A0A1L7CGB3_9CORY|nr:DEAD/DEAH box helicase [Corynebacterium aquilae]APT84902.1 DEAD/DEAH box helicase [Corynebacterium aquilae DSM 44791]